MRLPPLTEWTALLLPASVLLGTLLLGLAARSVAFRLLRRALTGNKKPLADIITQVFGGPIVIWTWIAGLDLAMEFSPLSRNAARVGSKALFILWILSFTLAASRLVLVLIEHYGPRWQGALPVTSLSQNLARLAVLGVGILIILSELGVSITPILTALGVGGLAVALALQDTLSNLFAGFYISLAGQVRLGDYVRLSSGEEGYVTDISWRSTSLRALPNNLILIPNAKLAQAIVTNYSLPEQRMSLVVPVSVSYDSDPEHVERVLIEVAREGAGEIPGLLAEPQPFVRFIPGFGDSSLDFTLICQVAQFVDQYPVQHELRKRIFQRFRRERIEIPYPIRTVYVKRDASPSVG